MSLSKQFKYLEFDFPFYVSFNFVLTLLPVYSCHNIPLFHLIVLLIFHRINKFAIALELIASSQRVATVFRSVTTWRKVLHNQPIKWRQWRDR